MNATRSTHEKTREEFDAPRPGWLPLAQATTMWAPTYLKSTADRLSAVRDEAADFFDNRNIAVSAELSLYDIALEFCGVSVAFDEENNVSLVDEEEAKNLNRFSNIYVGGASPYEFAEKCLTAANTSGHKDALRLAASLARRIDRMYRDGFGAAVAEGAAVLYGRVGSPMSPFLRIEPDQWRHLRVTDMDRGTAEGPAGEVVYSIHADPVIAAANPSELSALAPSGADNSKNLPARAQCERWLIDLLKTSPNQRTTTQHELRKEALRRWPESISGRQFDIAYQAARAKVDAPAWGRSGPIPRAPN